MNIMQNNVKMYRESRKLLFKDSRNTTIFGEIHKNNYMFRPLTEWAIIRLKTRKITEKIIQHNM
jgi:hypothetical protein